MFNRNLKKEKSLTEGPVVYSLVSFALPVLGALILQAAYGAVDLLVVGRFGDASSIAAVGTASAFMQMVTFIITSLAMGVTVAVGQRMGEGRGDLAGDAVGTAVVLFAALGVAATAALEFFAEDIASLLNVPAEAHAKAVVYLRICCGGTLIIIFYNVISAIMRGAGDANTPLLFVGVACAVNVAGDLLLTGLYGMDVAGVAIATVFAQFVSVAASVAFLRKHRPPFEFSLACIRVDRGELRRILRVGVPIALQETTVQISFLVINMIVNGMGLLQSAGYGVAQKVVSVIMLVPSSIMQSVSAFVAQNIGAGRGDRAVKGVLSAIAVGCGLGLFMFCAGFFFGGFLSSFFTEDGGVIDQSAAYLKGFSPECVLTCVLFSVIGYFNGHGESIPVMAQGLTSALLVRIPLCFFLTSLPGATLTLIGLATPVTTIYGILFFAACLAWMRRTRRGVSSII